MAKKKEIIEAKVKEEKEEKVDDDAREKNNNTSNISMTNTIIMGVIGIILLLLPRGANSIIGYIVGGALILVGSLSIIKYMKENIHPNKMSLISGLLYAILGLIIILNPLSIMKLITIILGVYLIVNGSLKLHSGYLLKDIEPKSFKSLLIAGTIIVILGIFLIIDPFSGLFITQLAGGFLIIVAIFDFINKK